MLCAQHRYSEDYSPAFNKIMSRVLQRIKSQQKQVQNDSCSPITVHRYQNSGRCASYEQASEDRTCRNKVEADLTSVSLKLPQIRAHNQRLSIRGEHLTSRFTSIGNQQIMNILKRSKLKAKNQVKQISSGQPRRRVELGRRIKSEGLDHYHDIQRRYQSQVISPWNLHCTRAEFYPGA